MAARGIKTHTKARGPSPELQDTRKRLLDTAAEVFADVGYHAATVREISGRACTNIALVNYHFGDKLGLYTEVLEQSVRSSHLDAIRGALDQNGLPEDILRAVIRARLRGLRDDCAADRQFRIVIHELAHPTPALPRVMNDITLPIYKRVLELIGGMIGLPPDDEKTRLCGHSVMGQIMHYALARPVLASLWPELKMTPEQLDRIADHIADFSLAYLRQVAPAHTQATTPENRRERK